MFKIIGKYITKKVLGPDSVLDGQAGIFSFQKAEFQLDKSKKILCKDISININPFGLITNSFSLCSMNCISMHFENEEDPKNVLHIDLKYPWAKCFYKNGLTLNMGYKEITANHSVYGQYTLKDSTYSIIIEKKSLFSLAFPSESVFQTSVSLSDVSFESKEFVLSINHFSIIIDLYPGKIKVLIPKIEIVMPLFLPLSKLMFGDIQLHYARPINTVPSLKLKELTLELNNMVFSSKSEKLIMLTYAEFNWDSLDSESYLLSLDRIEINYSTLDGLELFPLIKTLQGPNHVPTPTELKFPDLPLQVKSIDMCFNMTNNAVLGINLGQFEMKNRCGRFPKVVLCFNNIPTITMDSITFSSPDEKLLDLNIDSFVFHQKNQTNIALFIDETLYGVSLIKKYLSSGIFDSETLPFPIKLSFAEFLFKADDHPVSNNLLEAKEILPKVLRDKILLHYIMDLKLSQCQLNEEEKNIAIRKIDDLVFQKYKELINNSQISQLLIRMQNLNIDVDSTNFVGKVQMIHNLDSSVSELYSELSWETLEGFNATINASSISVKCFDIPSPIFEFNNLSLKGPIIIAEPDAKSYLNKEIFVGDQKINIKKTVSMTQIYSNLSIMIDSLTLFYGSALERSLDNLSDVFSTILSDGSDPSPLLKWWDKLRMMFRGSYFIGMKLSDLRFYGTSNPYNQSDFLRAQFKDFGLSIKDHISITSSSLVCTRGINGPIIINFPHFAIRASIVWQNLANNPNLHICIPDISRFGYKDYDTFVDVRATGYIVDADISFSSDDTNPYLSIDIAHFDWNIAPFDLLINSPHLDSAYKRKYFFPPTKPNPKINSLGKLNQVITYKVDVPSISIRVFDHYPIAGNTKINGSSLDITLVHPNITCTTKYIKGNDDILDVCMKCHGIQLNATDLPLFARNTQQKSITFVEIGYSEINYGSTSSFSIGKIQIYANQLFVKYISEFISTISRINDLKKSKSSPQESEEVHKIPSRENSYSTDIESPENNGELLSQLLRRRKSQRTVFAGELSKNKNQRKSGKIESFEGFPEVLSSATIPKIEIVIESLQYEASILLVINQPLLTLFKNESLGTYAAELSIRTISSFTSIGFEASPEEQVSPIISFDNVTCSFRQVVNPQNPDITDNIVSIGTDILKIDTNTNQIATFKQIIGEITPEGGSNEKELALAESNSTPFSLELSIAQTQIELRDRFKMDVAVLYVKELFWRADTDQKGGINISITVENIFANDLRKEAKFDGVVLIKWSDISSSGEEPHIRIQAKKAPPVGGVSVFNHVEINLSPTIFNYDSLFSEIITSIIDSPIIAPKTDHVQYYIRNNAVIPLPSVLIPPDTVPSIEDECVRILISRKSSEINIMIERADSNYYIRYFLVTSCRLNVSYINEENLIVSEIKGFNGVLHDLKYQDLTISFSDLASRMISDIALDIIPQFLKHMVGLGKAPPNKESELKQWLSNHDQGELQDKKKQIIFGTKKGNKN